MTVAGTIPPSDTATTDGDAQLDPIVQAAEALKAPPPQDNATPPSVPGG